MSVNLKELTGLQQLTGQQQCWHINIGQSCRPKRRQRKKAMEEEEAPLMEAAMKTPSSFSVSLYLHVPQANIIMDMQ